MPFRTRVKICGITSLVDAELAVRMGADALGFIFYEPSRRYVDPEQVAAIVAALPPFVDSVAVVVDLDQDRLRFVADTSGVSYVQFHGSEPLEQCDSVGKPYLKAVRVNPDTDISAVASYYRTASALLLDTYETDLPGGTGRTFDWSSIPDSLPQPVFLAGGLNDENVIDGIAHVRPYGVDVSTGVESSPGIKDPEKMRRFFDAVRRADDVG